MRHSSSMASDAAAREAEVGALCAIFGDAVEWARAHAWEAGGEGWCGTVTVRLRAADHPVVLLCHLGASYPTRAPPYVRCVFYVCARRCLNCGAALFGAVG